MELHLVVDDLADLVRQAQSGDREAIATLCQQEWATVYRVIAAATRGRCEAEELTQEVFVRVLGRLDGFRPGEGSFRAYLVTVARNLTRDRWRAARRHPVAVTEMAELAAADPGPEADAVAATERAALSAALSRLSTDHQHVLRLRLLEGLTAIEVGAIVGRSPEAVRQLQRRALVALRGEMDQTVERGVPRG